MKKSTLFMIVSVVLALTLSLGGTLAYLTDTDYDTNVMVLGNIDIEQHETDNEGKTFVQGQMLLPIVGSASLENGYNQPDNFIEKIVTVENVGNYDAYVRTFVAVPVYTYEGQNVEGAYDNVLHWKGHSDTDAAPTYPVANQYPVWENGKTVIETAENNWYWGKEGMGDWPGNNAADKWNKFFTEIDGQKYEVFVATNLEKVAPGERTAPNLMGLYLDSNVDYNGEFYTYEGKKIDNFDGVVEVLVATQAVQYDKGWAEDENDQFAAFKALNTAFGAPAADKHPWMPEYDIPEYTFVYTAEELATALANNESVTLGEDIDLTGIEWQPIGNHDDGVFFTGTLDGNGYTISGLNVTGDDYAGLIAAAHGATIKNLTVEGTVNAPNAAGIVARASGNTTIENCVSNVAVNGTTKAGGIVCNVTNGSATFVNCVNNGDVTGDGASHGLGGMVGYVNNNGAAHFIDCTNNGDITSTTKYTGAVIGNAAGGNPGSYGTIENFVNTGVVNGLMMSDDRKIVTEDNTVLIAHCAYPDKWTVK